MPNLKDEETLKNVTVAEKIPVILNQDAKQQDLLDGDVMREDITIESTSVATDSDVVSSQTIKETQTFVIVGVIDPRDREQISIYRAISDGIISQKDGLYINPVTGESMPIPEAMNRGLILVEFTNRSVEAGELIRQGVIKTMTAKETVSYSVQSVMDPVTGRRISIVQAVEKGIIDQDTGRYINPLTGDSISLQDAVERGFLDVETMERNPREDMIDGVPFKGYKDMNMNGPQSALLNNDLIVCGVRDPKTGKELTLEEAVQKGLVDLDKGIYKDYRTGKEISLIDAIKHGYLKVKLADPVDDMNNRNRLSARVLKIKTHQIESIESLVTPQLNGGLGSEPPLNTNIAIYEKIKGDLDTTKGVIVDQKTGRKMNISDAFESGILHMDPLCVEDAAGDRYSLQEAALLDLVDLPTAKEIYKALQPYSLAKLIESGELRTSTGQYIDPTTGQAMSLSQAIEQDKVDPQKVFYIDVPSHNVTSLKAAIENKKWDADSGKVVDSKIGKEVMPDEAIAKHIIDPKVDAEKLCDQVSALKFLKGHLDTSMKGIKHPITGANISIEEAVRDGILDIPHTDFVDISTGKSMSIAEAVDAKLIDLETAKQIYGAISNVSLGEALSQAQIDANTGKFIHPETKRKMTIKEAVDKGFLDPKIIFFVDPTTKKVTSLASAIEEGKFNPVTGKFRDPLTNLEVSISNAIKKGIIDPSIHPEAIIEEKATLKDMISSGKVTSQNATFVTPDGQTMSLKEALANGFLTADSIVKLDPKTGHITAADSNDMLKTLVNTKKKLDWLEGIEASLASQGRPSEDVNEVEEQLKIHEVFVKTFDCLKSVCLFTCRVTLKLA